LVLLLEEGNRFSIDIDIMSMCEREKLEGILDKVTNSSHFIEWKLDEHRSYKSGVPKAHYKFSFDTEMQGSGTILLDILIEDSIYPEEAEMAVATKWIETDEKTLVTVPTIDSITGDKLTAFAPNTIGIPYFKGKDKQSFSKEICKQLFDVSKLFERIENIETVAKSFNAFAEQEIAYRKNGKLTPNLVLQDTIETCAILVKSEKGSDEEKSNFKELQKGIKAFNTGFLMKGNFRLDDAIPAAARIAYLATKIQKRDLSPISYYAEQDIKDLIIEDTDWNYLNRLKKQPDKSSFYYWYHAVQLITCK
jgi:predicted nucleotidyltransferase component of viral defense system